MAREDFETSPTSGQSVALYKVQYGDNSANTFTNADQPITYDGEVYDPHPISHSELESQGDLSRGDISLTVPLSSPIAEHFRIFPPGRVVALTIREGHVSNPDDPAGWASGENFPVGFQGRILESRRQGNEVRLTCEQSSTSMNRVGLRRHYQWSCPLVLYGSRCQADKGAASTSGTVSAITGNVVTLNSAWEAAGRAGADYNGGILEWTSTEGDEARTILNVDGDDITLDGPPFDLEASDSVTVVLGCPHTLAGCAELHDNIVNYGGHPFIPTRSNPIGKNNHL